MFEKQIESPVVKWAKKQGIKIKKKVRADQLDRWFFFGCGNLFIIEFKVPGNKLTELQQLEIEELHALGFDVEVHDDKEAAIEALELRINLHGVTPNQMEASQIPERFRSLATDSRVCRTVRRSGDGKDKHNAGGANYFKERGRTR